MKTRAVFITAAFILLFSSCSYTETPKDIKAQTSSFYAATSAQASSETIDTPSSPAQTTAAQTEPPAAKPVIELSYEASAGLRLFYVKSPDSFKGNNPAEDSQAFTELPVFVNKYPLGNAGAKYTITEEVLRNVKNTGLALSQSLGLPILSQSLYSEAMPIFSAVCADAEITSLPGYTALALKPGQTFLPGLDSYVPGENSTTEEIENTALSVSGLLGPRLASFKPISNPSADVRLSYKISGVLETDSVRVFDSGSDALSAVLSYNFNYVSFAFGGDNGVLSLISFTDFDIGEKLGDYPLVSETRARELLLQGGYISTVTASVLKNGLLSGGDIAFCELVYLKELPGLLYFIPAYRFYVELDPAASFAPEGYAVYGEFYVPAVEPELIRVTRP